MKRVDNVATAPWLSAALYGKPGTGKTTMGVTAPKPLILLSESQGAVHIKQAAKRLGKPVPTTLLCDKVDDYRNVLRALHGDKAQPFRVYERYKDEEGEMRRHLVLELEEWPETVVLDSLTDCARLVVEEIRQQSPPKTGKDGLPADGQRFWQVLADRMKNLILGFRDAPVHKLYLCLADDRDVGEDDNKKRSVTPDLPMRKLPDALASAVNTMGYTYRIVVRRPNKEAEIQYGVMTVGPEYMLLKPYRPLRDVETPNFARWVSVIHGSTEPDSEPAPGPSQEIDSSVIEVEKTEDTQEEPKEDAPKGTLTDEQEERAAIIEYDGKVPRSEAEKAAREQGKPKAQSKKVASKKEKASA